MEGFKYESGHPALVDPKGILVIGKPPVWQGYMNPLAKWFFNKAAEFAEVIAEYFEGF